MKKLLSILTILLIGVIFNIFAHPVKKQAKCVPTAEIGKTLPAWSEGCFDIHFINSARGECCFYILPDGTTLLVDAGESVGAKDVAQRPNDRVRPYITYANYINHFLPSRKRVIDYCLPSHFHTDHIGGPTFVEETSPAGYRKAGLLALYDEVPYRKILDRAYPHYTEEELSGALALDWGEFVMWGVKSGKFKAEQFVVGKEQIVMERKPKKYKSFSIFNICANGQVWGRDADGNEKLYGKRRTKGGNHSSCGFRVRYGNFDYIACGDLTSGAQNRVAYYFRDFIGEGNLDAFKCHHHLASNSWGSKMQEFNFNPRVVLNHCFSSHKPNIEKLAYVLPMVEGFFATNIHPEILASEEVQMKGLDKMLTGYNGHIVLRVAPGGDRFYVYMLEDGDFEYRVKSIHGPYISK